MKGRSMSMEVKRDLRNSIILSTVAYGSEVWERNEAEQTKIRAVEMSYLTAASGISVLDRMRNKEVYEICRMALNARGKNG